jgi:hypothetical protein
VHVDAAVLRTALHAQAARRGLTLPTQFTIPDPAYWRSRYTADIRRMPEIEPRTLDDALTLMAAFIDPILRGTAHGIWDPTHRRWTH